jgi:Glycosyltransferase
MKILLYTGHLKLVEKSGVGRAIYHQQKALEANQISYTTNKKESYDIVHINTIFPSSLLRSSLAKASGKKVVYHAHSTEEDFKNSFLGSNVLSPLYKKWIMKCYNSGDLIITPTPYSKKLLEGYGLNRPIVPISNGIDLDYFSTENGSRKRFRDKYHLKDTDKVIISAGLYIERKGILDFIKLAKELPQYQFIWFGYTNPNMVSKRVRAAIETKLPNLLFPGYVNRDELRDAYRGSDLFLFLTQEETEGIVILEALAMKIPVLLRDIPIYSDWLLDGNHVYKGKSISEFQVKINEILINGLPSLVENGYSIVREREIKAVGQQLRREYEKLMVPCCSHAPILDP